MERRGFEQIGLAPAFDSEESCGRFTAVEQRSLGVVDLRTLHCPESIMLRILESRAGIQPRRENRSAWSRYFDEVNPPKDGYYSAGEIRKRAEAMGKRFAGEERVTVIVSQSAIDLGVELGLLKVTPAEPARPVDPVRPSQIWE
jgi:hypothetical protein